MIILDLILHHNFSFYQEVPSYHYFNIVSLILITCVLSWFCYQNIFDSLQQKHKTSKQPKEKKEKTLELSS